MANTIQINSGKRAVVAMRNDAGSPWSARLYVNVAGGDVVTGDATLVCTKRATEAGVRKWAEKVMAA